MIVPLIVIGIVLLGAAVFAAVWAFTSKWRS